MRGSLRSSTFEQLFKRWLAASPPALAVLLIVCSATPATPATPNVAPSAAVTPNPGSAILLNSEYFTVTRLDLAAEQSETLHALGGSVFVPRRGTSCTLEADAKASPLKPNVSQWLHAEELVFSAPASGRCSAYLVEIKKPKGARPLASKNTAADPRFESIDLENSDVRALRFKLAPRGQWTRTSSDRPPANPSVTLVLSSANLVTRQAWSSDPDSVSWVESTPTGPAKYDTKPPPKTTSFVLENVGKESYEVLTLQLKFSIPPNRKP